MSGLESQLEKNKLGGFNDEVRYSIKTKSFSQIEPRMREEKLEPTNKLAEEKIYDITKVGFTLYFHNWSVWRVQFTMSNITAIVIC